MATPSAEELELRALLASRHALIIAGVRDEAQFLALLRSASWSLQYPVWTWSAARGLARDGMAAQANTLDGRVALSFVRELDNPGVFAFLDATALMHDDVVVRLAKEIGLKATPGQTLVLTGPDAQVPPALVGVALPWRQQPPDRAEMRGRVIAMLDQVRAANLPIDPAIDVEHLVDAVLGLTGPEAERLILREAFTGTGLEAGDVAEVRKAKAELVSNDGVLELVPVGSGMKDVGGLENLKRWLAERGRGFEPAARDFGIDPPRGVLVTGIPGTGKSLVAKSLAASWGLPLVLLDPGRIYGSLVGESEARLRDALTAVGVMAPVVVWIDEIEKGFARDAGGDSGVSARVLGTFLRWLQDRPQGVFVIATANDVEKLPPELLRKGRFDEIFFVDLPRPDERAAILQSLLRKRGRDPRAFELGPVVAATEGFSGAELEAVLVSSLYAAYAAGSDLSADLLVAEARETVPLSVTRAEDVDRLRDWARSRAVPASAPLASPAAGLVVPPAPDAAVPTDEVVAMVPVPPAEGVEAAAVSAQPPGMPAEPPVVATEPAAVQAEPAAMTPPPVAPTPPPAGGGTGPGIGPDVPPPALPV